MKMVENDSIVASLICRIKDIEQAVYGHKFDKEDYSYNMNSQIYKQLKDIQTVLMSKTSDRQKISMVLSKVEMIENILDPMFGEVKNEKMIKTDIILQDEEKIKNFIKQLEVLQKSNEIVTNEPFAEILVMQGKIDELSKFLSKTFKLVKEQEAKIDNLAKGYNETMLHFTDMFTKLDHLITELEIEASKKEGQVI